MIPTRSVEKKAEAYAEKIAATASNEEEAYAAKKIARYEYLDSMSSESIFKVPLLGATYTYDDLKSRQIAFGLDLKGGMSSVLQVDLKDLLVSLSRDSRDENFLQALDNAEESLKNSQSDFISLFGQEYNKIDGAKPLSRIFTRSDIMKEEDIDLNTPNGRVIQILREKANETVNLTFNRLKQRIDKLGVTQPNVSLDGSRDLILVEMPGIDNPERARNFLQASAELGFWETYRINDNNMIQAFTQADAKLKALKSGDDEVIEDDGIAFDTVWTMAMDSLGNETGDSTFQLVEKARDLFANQGPLLDIFSLNGTGSELQFPLTVAGSAVKNQRDDVLDMLNNPAVKSLFPADLEFMWGAKPYTDIDGNITKEYLLYMIKTPGTKKAPIEGDVIVSTSHGPNPEGQMAVNLRMNSKGAKKWAEMTTKAANNGNREVAISLDRGVVSAPRVNGAIVGGSTEITGDFSVQEANDLSSILEVGKLPANIKIIQESTVGPSLGKKNIDSSIRAMTIGFVLLLVFMILYYGGAGIVSIIALLLNLLFVFGALASIGTVLTLPGIAGIILTIGMAVDANVIIYERVREELRAGKSLLASIQDGFSNSYSAIIDANVTTFLVAAILAFFGLGPIKGFAVVLMVGVVSSLFTAVLLTRIMTDSWTKRGNKLSYWLGWSKNMFNELNINWLGKRKVAYVISGVLILAGIISMATRGFDLGVDFRGGYSYNVEFTEDVNVNPQTLRDGLTEYFGKQPVVKAVDARNTYNILTDYLIDSNDEGAAEEVITKLHEGVNAITGANIPLNQFKLTDSRGVTHVTSSSKVGPTIADDIKKSSWYAGIFALLVIFLYIFIRFNKWQFSLGAVAALFHDSLIVLGLFSLLWGIVPFALEIDQAFIAALLTVIGYSINDTVVVFDRIREDLGIYTKKSTDDVINIAVNNTVSRTVITSLTTLFVVLILFIFGGGSIKGFAFALLIGITVGTYSSIFIATPIMRDLTNNLKSKNSSETSSKKHFSKAFTAR